MRFQIRALDAQTRRMVSLPLDALDESDARAQLRARHLEPVSLQARTAAGWRTRRDAFDVGVFAQELHALVSAGLTLIESLEALVEKERSAATRVVLQRLIAALRSGQRLSAALRAQGDTFPALFNGIVESAENTGELAPALERYLAYAQRLHAVRQRMISAAIYPVILLGVGTLVALFLLGWVVPRFAAVYRDGGRGLPWASRLLLDWGDFAGRHGLLLLAGLVAAALLLATWVRHVTQRGGWAQVAAIVPGVARWLELLTLSRLFLTLGLLLRGGLPVQSALGLARSVLPAERAAALDRARERIAEGWPLSQALGEVGLATTISTRFLRAGERSGQLAEMLSRAAAYHDAETARWVDRFSRIFEPLLMAAIGLVIGVVVLLLYMPVFDLAGNVR